MAAIISGATGIVYAAGGPAGLEAAINNMSMASTFYVCQPDAEEGLINIYTAKPSKPVVKPKPVFIKAGKRYIDI